MRKKLIYSIICLSLLAFFAACSNMPSFGEGGLSVNGETLLLETPAPTLSPTPAATFTPTPTFTPAPTNTPIPTPTNTPEPDFEPPVIMGVEPIVAIQGTAVSYKKGVEVTDDKDPDVKLVVDNSQVDLNTPGEYKISYSATDSAGNMTIVFSTITIKDAVLADKEDTVNKLADELIASLITEDMSAWNKVYKLWIWCMTNIKYTSTTGDMTSEYTGAYEGLHDRRGDCYTYYATLKILLDKLGIENLKCSRTGGKSDHYWNLVNIGDGWYHCDASPRRAGDPFYTFMQTDNQVYAYTDSYRDIPNYYVFDKSALPETATLVVYDGWNHKKLKVDQKISEKTIQTKIEELKTLYPHGKYWNDGGVTDIACVHANGYDRCNHYDGVTNLLRESMGYGDQCFGFASMIQDYILGADIAPYEHWDFDKVRVGDQVRLDDFTPYCHSAVIIEKGEDYIVLLECNASFYDCKIEWGRKLTTADLAEHKVSYYSRSYELK